MTPQDNLDAFRIAATAARFAFEGFCTDKQRRGLFAKMAEFARSMGVETTDRAFRLSCMGALLKRPLMTFNDLSWGEAQIILNEDDLYELLEMVLEDESV